MREVQHDGWLERFDHEGELDEVVITAGIKSFHLERMDNGLWWQAIYLTNGRRVVVWIGGKNQMRSIVTARAEDERSG